MNRKSIAATPGTKSVRLTNKKSRQANDRPLIIISKALQIQTLRLTEKTNFRGESEHTDNGVEGNKQTRDRQTHENSVGGWHGRTMEEREMSQQWAC